MPHTGKKPLKFEDLAYSVTKLSFDDGQEIRVGRRADLALEEKGIFYMHLPTRPAIAKADAGARLTDICYSIRHRPTGERSPLFHHTFKVPPLWVGGGQTYIGPMKLYPAEGVWPELTRKGYYGELPQFYS